MDKVPSMVIVMEIEDMALEKYGTIVLFDLATLILLSINCS